MAPTGCFKRSGLEVSHFPTPTMEGRQGNAICLWVQEDDNETQSGENKACLMRQKGISQTDQEGRGSSLTQGAGARNWKATGNPHSSSLSLSDSLADTQSLISASLSFIFFSLQTDIFHCAWPSTDLYFT